MLPNGTQEVLDAPGKPVFTVTDLRDRNTTEIEQDLESIRETKTHQLLDLAAGQVIDISRLCCRVTGPACTWMVAATT